MAKPDSGVESQDVGTPSSSPTPAARELAEMVLGLALVLAVGFVIGSLAWLPAIISIHAGRPWIGVLLYPVLFKLFDRYGPSWVFGGFLLHFYGLLVMFTFACGLVLCAWKWIALIV